MKKIPSVKLHPGQHKRVVAGHPWIYSNEIKMDSATKAIERGTIVKFHAHDGSFIGLGSFNPHALISGRIFTRSSFEIINEEWLKARINKALILRKKIISQPYYRLVHAEADNLPGLIVDRFGQNICVQLNTAGMQKLWPEIEKVLKGLFNPKGIVLHNDSAARVLEGLETSVRVVLGNFETPIEVPENGIIYYADLVNGQKTGWYFDQRDNRKLIAQYAKDAYVLDLYCHSGGFGLLAIKSGAKKVLGIDSSASALALAEKAAVQNKIAKKTEWRKAHAFEELEKLAAAKERFGVVIADPPPFVKSRKDLAAGARGYRKLARLAAEVAAQEGILFIASCSYNMDLQHFIEEVARGIHEAKREGRILHTVFAAPDHPVHPHLPESSYLKGLMLVLD